MNEGKNGLTRSEFLKLAGAAVPGIALARGEAAATAAVADTILVGGKVLTVDASDSVAQAIAIKDGLVMQTGTDEAIRALAGPSTRVIELRGRTVTPGFVDPHNHFQLFGLFQTYYTAMVPPAVKDIAGLQAALPGKLAEIPAGQWFNGYYWMAAIPNRHDLDPVSPNHPVWLMHQAGHYGSANSLALQLANITAVTASPTGGIIEKDENGEPTGVFYNHRAMDVLRRNIPIYTDQQVLDSMLLAQRVFASCGVTSFHDNNIRMDNIELYQQLYREGKLRVRGNLYYTLEYPADLDRALHGIDDYHDDYTRFAGYKFLIDGQTQTSYCHEPHAGICWDMPTWEPSSFKQTVRILHDTGRQICIHCVGDAATDLALDAYEEAMNANPRPDPRHRIEHCVLSTAEATQRMKDLGIIVSTNPLFIRFAGDAWVSFYGAERAKRCAVTREWLEAGVKLAIGSDAPTGPLVTPQATLAFAISRMTMSNTVLGPEQCLTFNEALRAHTIDAAYAGHEEAIKGSLEPGKLADLAVWSKDPASLPPNQLWNATIDITMVGGEVVHPTIRNPRRRLERAG